MARYVFSDLHGRLDLYLKIKEFIQLDDICYSLGDNIDRGPDGMEILWDMRRDKRFVMLKGNHEEMMAYVCASYEEGDSSNVSLWFQNGGEDTFYDYLNLDTGAGYSPTRLSFCRFLNKLPEKIEIINTRDEKIILTHAGFTPGVRRKIDYLWDREHFKDAWIAENEDNIIIIHGHTATFSKEVGGQYGKVYRYCNGHKINLDLATYNSGIIALYNLDTHEIKYIME